MMGGLIIITDVEFFAVCYFFVLKKASPFRMFNFEFDPI